MHDIQRARRAAKVAVMMASVASLAVIPSVGSDVPAAFVATDEGTVMIYPSSLPACDHEDGTASAAGHDVPACFWDATRGNGTGTSFIVLHK